MERFSSMIAASMLSALVTGSGPAAGGTSATPGATVGPANSAQLQWTPPTLNADGSTLSDLLGFNVYRGTSPTTMMLAATVSKAINTFADTNLTPSVWYWYVTSVNSMGVESAPSPLISKVVVAGSTGGANTGSTSGSTTGTTTGSTTGSTSGTPGGSSAGSGTGSGSTSPGTPSSPGTSTGGAGGSSGAGSSGGARSPYRANSLDAAARRTHCRPEGLILCVR